MAGVQSLDPDARYSFGSVRRDQGKVYKALGGAIIGVRRPGVGPSSFEFDRFDESLVDVWIDNDAGLKELREKVLDALIELRDLCRRRRRHGYVDAIVCSGF
jgi:hypothetical protein